MHNAQNTPSIPPSASQTSSPQSLMSTLEAGRDGATHPCYNVGAYKHPSSTQSMPNKCLPSERVNTQTQEILAQGTHPPSAGKHVSGT